MHGNATRSVAPWSDAVNIAQSAGQGTSTAFSVGTFDDSDTGNTSLTRAAAALRFAGVIRLRVPISSSLPHRPQFERSICHRSYWAGVVRAPRAGCGEIVWREGNATVPIVLTIIAVDTPSI